MNVDQRLTKQADVQERAPAGINIWVNTGNTRRMPEHSPRLVDVTSIAISNRHLDITPPRVSSAAPITYPRKRRKRVDLPFGAMVWPIRTVRGSRIPARTNWERYERYPGRLECMEIEGSRGEITRPRARWGRAPPRLATLDFLSPCVATCFNRSRGNEPRDAIRGGHHFYL